MDRPIGITLIAILNIVIGILLILGALSFAALAGLAVSGYGPDLIPGLTDLPYLDIMMALGGIIAVVLIIVALVEFIMAWGLLKGKGWAWILSIVFMFLTIALGFLSLVHPTAFNLIGLAIDALIVYYLFRPNVKAFFGRGPAVTYQPPATYPTTQASQAPPPPPQEAAQKTPACPRCGQALTWIDQYQRWYCYNCQQYA